MSRRLVIIALVAIFIIAAFFRFYDLPNRAMFGNETVRDAVVGLVGARQLQLPISGPFSSIGSFTFGPWYWYHLIFGYLFLPTAYAAWYVLAGMSLVYVVVLFAIGFLLDGPVLGLIAAYLVAISPTQLVAAMHLTQPNLLLLYVGLVVLIFLLITHAQRLQRFLVFVLGLTYGIAVNFHYQAISLAVVILSAIIWLKHLKPLPYLILGFILVNLPLLAFNLLNHWHTLRNVCLTVGEMDKFIYVPNSWRIYLFQFWPELWSDHLGISRWLGLIWATVVVLTIAWSLWKKQNRRLPAIIASLGAMFILLRYYKGERFLSYYNFFSPFIFILSAWPLAFLFKIKTYGKFVIAGLLLVYSLLVLPKSLRWLTPNEFTIHMKAMAGTIMAEYGQKAIMIYNCKAKNLPRDFSLTFLLGIARRLGKDGVKVGFETEGCSYPLVRSYATDTLNKIGLMDLSETSDATLSANNWVPLTLEGMYDVETKWWYKEKP